METQPVLPVKLIIAVLYNQSVNDIKIKEILKPVFGMWDHCSPTHDFNFTDYYHREMGAIEKRLLLSFKKLIKPDDLTHIKLLTNEMEKRFMTNGCRQINFDPGYLDLDKVILASAKYARQKIYLSSGIYADPVLYYYSKAFHSYEWSFPDFKSGIYNNFLFKVRQTYKRQLNDDRT